MEKPFNLEDRTFIFARNIAIFCKKLQKNQINIEYIKQVIRSSGSVGANYIEANEALSKKDFIHRVRISRKEAKETAYWLNLIIQTNNNLPEEAETLLQESIELKKILSAILEKSK